MVDDSANYVGYDVYCQALNSAVRYHPRYASSHYQPYAIVQIGNRNHDLQHDADNWNIDRRIHILRTVANTMNDLWFRLFFFFLFIQIKYKLCFVCLLQLKMKFSVFFLFILQAKRDFNFILNCTFFVLAEPYSMCILLWKQKARFFLFFFLSKFNEGTWIILVCGEGKRSSWLLEQSFVSFFVGKFLFFLLMFSI